MTSNHHPSLRPDDDRLSAWGDEMRRVHQRLRQALELAGSTLAEGTSDPEVDLLLYCHGFCTALDGHHDGEDTQLFPRLLERRPDLAETVAALKSDHSMIAHLIGQLRAEVAAGGGPEAVGRHLDGIGAIMESHFRYEEKALLAELDAASFDALEPAAAFGPLAI